MQLVSDLKNSNSELTESLSWLAENAQQMNTTRNEQLLSQMKTAGRKVVKRSAPTQSTTGDNIENKIKITERPSKKRNVTKSNQDSAWSPTGAITNVLSYVNWQ
jgi:hypothetical protein